MSDQHITTSPPGAAPAEHGHSADAHFKAYMMVFGALCVLTGVSFLSNLIVNHILEQKAASAAIIMLVSVVKATLVGLVFMHLNFDWKRVYGIMIPVCIMAIMMMIVLLPDVVLGWHFLHAE